MNDSKFNWTRLGINLANNSLIISQFNPNMDVQVKSDEFDKVCEALDVLEVIIKNMIILNGDQIVMSFNYNDKQVIKNYVRTHKKNKK